jgi:hypothetical protein
MPILGGRRSKELARRTDFVHRLLYLSQLPETTTGLLLREPFRAKTQGKVLHTHELLCSLRSHHPTLHSLAPATLLPKENYKVHKVALSPLCIQACRVHGGSLMTRSVRPGSNRSVTSRALRSTIARVSDTRMVSGSPLGRSRGV